MPRILSSRTPCPTLALNRQRSEHASGLIPAEFPATEALQVGAEFLRVGVAALAVLTFLVAPQVARAQASYTVIDLTPAGSYSEATGVNGNAQVGYNGNHALLWHGTAASVVDLNPTGFSNSYAAGVFGNTQVGYGTMSGSYDTHALLWKGTAASVVDLQPAGFTTSQANGIFDDTQVGQGYIMGTGGFLHALLWKGTASSAVDLNPTGFTTTEAIGISGDTQVGLGYPSSDADYIPHALLWKGTADSAVDLHPTGYYYSLANGVDGDTQVGMVVAGDFDEQVKYAFLWHGTAASAVNLTPHNDIDSRNNFAEALAVSGNTQVGDGDINGGRHALAWHGTASSIIDLNDFLPTGYNTQSAATGINASGDIVGYGSGSAGSHAFLWRHMSVAAPVITSLDPASRTEGREDFTLTVTGSGFTSKSVVLWNTAPQTTTFVSATKLTASIPASLIGSPGMAGIAVLTSNTALSNPRTETINPRPSIQFLSPKSKTAGSSAITLTIAGAGFLSKSIVKWNGAELATTYVSSTQLTAQVPASLLTKSGTASVTVTTPQVATSKGRPFTIKP